jgi:uncharacterized protein (TIGR02246 family)
MPFDMAPSPTVVAVTALLAATGVGVGGGASAQQPSAPDAEAVRAANAAFFAALSARDMAAFEGVWARDSGPLAVLPTSRSAVVGWDAIRKDYEGVFRRYSEFSISMPESEVRVAPGGALVVGIETVRGKLASGEGANFSLLATNVFERRDGRWLLVHHHASRMPQ